MIHLRNCGRTLALAAAILVPSALASLASDYLAAPVMLLSCLLVLALDSRRRSMHSHFKLDPPAQVRLPRYVARSGGLHLAAGEDLREVALRGCRLAYPGGHVVVYEGLRVVAVVCPEGQEPYAYSPEELREELHSTLTVVPSQEVG